MKKLVTIGLALPLFGCTTVQIPAESSVLEYPPAPPPTAEATPVVAAPVLFSAQQLDQLLGPIALYPDPLIALMLPAATLPSDVTAAAAYLRSGGSIDAVESQPWDDSVRALAHYPDVVNWMADNLTWTQQLGDAFASQSADVMAAVQRLRQQARAAGTLADTPQQRIVYEADGTIAIVPARPDVIYVPYYDPAMVYTGSYSQYAYSPGSYFNFSPGFSVGLWLSYGVDWRNHHVWSVDRNDRERFWREHHDDWARHYQRPRPPGPGDAHYRVWQPPPNARRWPGHGFARPPGQSAPPPGHREPPRDARHDGRDRDHHPWNNPPPAVSPAPANPSATPAPFVGPTAMRPLPQQPAPPPAVSTPAPHRGDWPREHNRPPTRPPETRPPAPTPRPSTPRYDDRGHAGRNVTPPPAANPPAPRPAPPLHVAPPPPARSAPAPAQPQSEQSGSQDDSQPQRNDENHRKPPFVRMR